MKSDHQQNRYKQQEKIKKRLYMIDFEDSNDHQYKSKNLFQYTGNLKRKQSDYKDLSDWTSSYIVNRQDPQINNKKQDKKTGSRKFDFFNKTRYPSALLSYNSQQRKQRPYISPMIIKFNAKILSKNLESAQQNFIKKLKEDLYITHYKNKGIIFDRLSKNKKEKYLRNTHIQISNIDQSSENPKFLPKTQRTSAILRLLKKRQPSRVRRDYYQEGYKEIVPDLRTTKIF